VRPDTVQFEERLAFGAGPTLIGKPACGRHHRLKNTSSKQSKRRDQHLRVTKTSSQKKKLILSFLRGELNTPIRPGEIVSLLYSLPHKLGLIVPKANNCKHLSHIRRRNFLL